MRLFDQRTARVILTVLLFAAVLGFLWLARKPLIIFLFAVLFAYLLEPLVAWVQPRVRNSRGLAILSVYVVGLVGLGIIGALLGPRVVDESQKLAHAAPKMYERIASGDIAWQLAARRGWSRETAQSIQQFLASHRDAVLNFVNSLGARGSKLATNLGWLGLIPILAIFFLKDKARFSQAVQGLVDDTRERKLLRNVLSDLDEMLAHYIRAQLYLAAISGAVYTVVLGLVLRVPFGFALGIMGGLLEFVPVVGPLIAAIVILGVAFTTNYSHMLIVLLFLGAWRVIQDYVVSPHVLGGRVELHPLAAIFGVLVGAEIGGVVGVYLAIPAMAAIRILWRAGRRYGETVEIRDITREAA
ncbi:MAG TPA: AI-2E family transporter [Terriglobales bacterium]|nr:AI-2E family transporter [Terriglobales bacterium]